jgi:hypothetical protein
MGLSLESMAIEMPRVAGHPNRAGFRGVLTVVDVVSDRAPAGARGHRVMLTRKAAEEAIPSLLGMALDYSPRLDAHDTRRKIGVITRAEIVGRELFVGGYLYARDFPEVVEAISHQPSAVRAVAGRQSLVVGKGSHPYVAKDATKEWGTRPSQWGTWRVSETSDAGDGPFDCRSGQVRATQAGLGMSYEIADARVEDLHASVWVLNKVTFTGAAVLKRDKAAYQGTWIELE